MLSLFRIRTRGNVRVQKIFLKMTAATRFNAKASQVRTMIDKFIDLLQANPNFLKNPLTKIRF